MNDFHFCLISATEWRTGKDLRGLMQAMDKQRQTYTVWLIPTRADAEYEFMWYTPQVKGAVALQTVEYRNGRRVSAPAETTLSAA